ncbi:hypothetical protein LUR56_11740 [Streptomyces sp. MT29]|nr:hypothetical protein [Streptomyces sp. MT29]
MAGPPRPVGENRGGTGRTATVERRHGERRLQVRDQDDGEQHDRVVRGDGTPDPAPDP